MAKKLEWSTVQRKVTELLPLEINPRKISEEKRDKLIKSIEKFNLAEIPAINLDGKIIAGNQRVKALQLIGRGDELIDVRIPNRTLTEKELKEYNLIANTHSGEWDADLLSEHFSEFDFADLGIELPEVGDVLELEASEDDYTPPPLEQIKTDIVVGDVFEIGQHRLICGDSTQIDTFKTLFKDEFADMVVTDPPYNVDYEGGTGLKIMNDKMDDDKFYRFLYDFYTALNSFVKKGGVWYVWHADSEGANFRLAMKNAGIKVRQCLIWVKSSIVLGRQDYHWKHEPCLEGENPEESVEIKTHEPCLYGWKDGVSHKWYNDRKQSTILEFDKPKKNGEHPTMKPVELIAYQIKNNSKVSDLVADGFGGSGTTMVASHQLKRKCFMVEFDPKYCQVIVDRMIKLDSSIEIKRNGKKYKK